MAESKASKKSHSLILQDRKDLQLTGVSDVGNFDDTAVTIFTDIGELLVRGKNLQINNLSLEKGEVHLSGEIDSLSYGEKESRNAGFLSKIFK
ncbi:MAG: sporulation protein YabP [Oscillospiraceae bacterium]|nr:sporulation protein YabP [Oscillospiraceae bacterium]